MSLDLVNILLNSFLSRKGAKVLTLDIKIVYLQTLLDRSEYVRVIFDQIPQDFINE